MCMACVNQKLGAIQSILLLQLRGHFVGKFARDANQIGRDDHDPPARRTLDCQSLRPDRAEHSLGGMRASGVARHPYGAPWRDIDFGKTRPERCAGQVDGPQQQHEQDSHWHVVPIHLYRNANLRYPQTFCDCFGAGFRCTQSRGTAPADTPADTSSAMPAILGGAQGASRALPGVAGLRPDRRARRARYAAKRQVVSRHRQDGGSVPARLCGSHRSAILPGHGERHQRSSHQPQRSGCGARRRGPGAAVHLHRDGQRGIAASRTAGFRRHGRRDLPDGCPQDRSGDLAPYAGDHPRAPRRQCL